jgi:hypothetical protein
MKKLLLGLILLAPIQALAATISVNPSTVVPGATVIVSVRGATSVSDWVQIVPAGTAEGNRTVAPGWEYLNGSTTKPATVITDADLRMTAPSLAGIYEARFYPQGSRTSSASAPLTVSSTGGFCGSCGSPACSATDVAGSICPNPMATCVAFNRSIDPPALTVRACDDVTLTWREYTVK